MFIAFAPSPSQTQLKKLHGTPIFMSFYGIECIFFRSALTLGILHMVNRKVTMYGMKM